MTPSSYVISESMEMLTTKVEPAQLGPTDRASLCLHTQRQEQNPVSEMLFKIKKQDNG
jgi:hypothetical protein